MSNDKHPNIDFTIFETKEIDNNNNNHRRSVSDKSVDSSCSSSSDQSSSTSSSFESNTECQSVSECKSIHRIITALTYYQILNKTNNNAQHHGQSIFTDFLLQQYQNYLNDIIHLRTKHKNELEEIQDILLTHPQYKPCNIKECIFIDRHCGIDDGLNGDINGHIDKLEPISSVHIQIWDSVHYNLVHSFQLGIRKRKGEENKHNQDEIKDNLESDDIWNIRDNYMNKQSKEIKRNRSKFGRFYGRYNNKTNKFTIHSVKTITDTKVSMTPSTTTYAISRSEQKVIQSLVSISCFSF